MRALIATLVFVATFLTGCAQAPANQPAAGAASDASAVTARPATEPQPAVEAKPATEPQTAVEAKPAAEPAVEAATAQTPAPAPTTASPSRSVGSSSAPTASRYHIIERNGTKFYCTDQPAMGTRIKSRTTCLTEAQYEVARQDAQQKMREKQGQRQHVEQ